MPCDIIQPDGFNGTLTTPISSTGIPEYAQRYLIPAREGRAVRLQNGETLTITNEKGNQVCDFFALTADSPGDFLSMEHCRTALGRIYVRKGDTLVTNRREGLIEIIEDSSPGVHDILIASCDRPRYVQLGAEGYHDNCADNFKNALAAIGITPIHVPSPFNIWMNIPVDATGTYQWRPPVSKAGDQITLKALSPCIVVMSACPQDMTPVNGIGVKPSELSFVVHAAKSS